MPLEQIVCSFCRKEFVAKTQNKRKYCSHRCYANSRKNSIKRNCKTCGNEFVAKLNQAKKGKGQFCSRRCSRLGKNNPSWNGGSVLVNCARCGKEIERNRSMYTKNKTGKHYCSQDCFKNWLRDNPANSPAFKNGGGCNWECENCEQQFWRAGRKKYRFCSRKCTVEYMIGEKNPGWKRTVSICKWCGEQYEHLPSVKRRFCSHKCHEAHQQADPANNPVWKGGITPELNLARARMIYKHWQKAVFERDNWECRQCGKHGGELHAHHLYSFREFPHLRYNINNGHTLCPECHMKLNSHDREIDYLLSIGLDPNQPPLL